MCLPTEVCRFLVLKVETAGFSESRGDETPYEVNAEKSAWIQTKLMFPLGLKLPFLPGLNDSTSLTCRDKNKK